MAQKTFHIELRVNDINDGDEKYETIKKAAQQAARTLHAVAMLACADGQKPQIILYGEDFVSGKEEVEHTLTDEDKG